MLTDERFKWYKKTSLVEFFGKIIDALLILIRDGAGYGILIWQYTKGNISVGDFVFYLSAITGFSAWLTGIINSVNKYHTICFDIIDLRAFLDLQDCSSHFGKPIPVDTSYSITLENVSYHYDHSKTNALSNINLTIKNGEKLALVGANGAGKSTLVGIICGLLRPSDGKVLLNGVDINEYNIDDYQYLFSAVFQNMEFLPLTIEENITLSESLPDRERLSDCIKSSGFQEKLNQLELGEKTKLVKSVHSDAIELSGGEMQKLALARALYKQAPLLILDEPTAALDPIAESEIYMKYAEMTEDKTAVYVSHRLASTKFCNRIIFIKNGMITETGTHDSLIKSGGDYAEMYETQSKYYQNQELERRAFG